MEPSDFEPFVFIHYNIIHHNIKRNMHFKNVKKWKVTKMEIWGFVLTAATNVIMKLLWLLIGVIVKFWELIIRFDRANWLFEFWLTRVHSHYRLLAFLGTVFYSVLNAISTASHKCTHGGSHWVTVLKHTGSHSGNVWLCSAEKVWHTQEVSNSLWRCVRFQCWSSRFHSDINGMRINPLRVSANTHRQDLSVYCLGGIGRCCQCPG